MVGIRKVQHRKFITVLVVLALITAGLAAWWYIESKRDDILVLATTTSTYDSGLLDEIVPDFEETYGVRVKTIAMGTGQALELGRNGDADVILVHAPEREEEFVEEGYGKYRYEVMYNEFVLVGPEDDPAGVRESQDVSEAFNRLYENRGSITFCSRGDDSGTHIKEIELWEDAGFDHDEIDSQAHSHWYKSLGQGMGDTLRTANELDGYALTDEATYISLKEEVSGLDIHFSGDQELFNQYGVIPVCENMNPNVNNELGEEFASWIVSEEVQDMIDNYIIDGEKIFTANAQI